MCQGDTVWLASGSKVLRIELAGLKRVSEANIPLIENAPSAEELLGKFDANGNGKLERREWRIPTEIFTRADKNRDNVIAPNELKALPPLPPVMPSEDNTKIALSDTDVILIVGGNLHRFDKATLKLKGTVKIERK